MGLLDQLWDDTVAGPPPDNGLGKLRKFSGFRSNSGKDLGVARSYGDDGTEEAIRVTRSIMIVKPPGYQASTPPASPAGVSPAGYTPPVSPFSGKLFADHDLVRVDQIAPLPLGPLWNQPWWSVQKDPRTNRSGVSRKI